jgi:TrmH family RNA methyltransferase
MALTITSTRNSRIVDARKLAQRKHRQRQGRFLVEGLQILHMALDAGANPQEVFYCADFFTGTEAPRLLERFRQTNANLVTVSEHVMNSLSERDASQGITVTFDLFESSLETLELDSNGLIVILDRLQDPGNMGTLIRTADAVGARAVVLLEPCVDPFDPKTVRGSMGSLFNVPLARTTDVTTLFESLRAYGIQVVGADAHRGQVWGKMLWVPRQALILGNEARGLSEDVGPYITDWVHLPIVGKAESLNVAVAGGVLMYQWLQKTTSE